MIRRHEYLIQIGYVGIRLTSEDRFSIDVDRNNQKSGKNDVLLEFKDGNSTGFSANALSGLSLKSYIGENGENKDNIVSLVKFLDEKILELINSKREKLKNNNGRYSFSTTKDELKKTIISGKEEFDSKNGILSNNSDFNEDELSGIDTYGDEISDMNVKMKENFGYKNEEGKEIKTGFFGRIGNIIRGRR